MNKDLELIREQHKNKLEELRVEHEYRMAELTRQLEIVIVTK